MNRQKYSVSTVISVINVKMSISSSRTCRHQTTPKSGGLRCLKNPSEDGFGLVLSLQCRSLCIAVSPTDCALSVARLESCLTDLYCWLFKIGCCFVWYSAKAPRISTHYIHQYRRLCCTSL